MKWLLFIEQLCKLYDKHDHNWSDFWDKNIIWPGESNLMLTPRQKALLKMIGKRDIDGCVLPSPCVSMARKALRIWSSVRLTLRNFRTTVKNAMYDICWLSPKLSSCKYIWNFTSCGSITFFEIFHNPGPRMIQS